MPDPGAERRRVLVEPELVEVEQDGAWWPGTLDQWADWTGTGWKGHCRWTTRPGSTFLMWVPEARVRPRTPAVAAPVIG